MKIKKTKIVKKESGANNIFKKVKVKKSFAGLGLFADEDIKKREIIIEYTGRELSEKEKEIEDGGNENMYIFEISSKKTIDGSGKENIARYANHSCDANAESEIIRDRVFLRAVKNISKGEEITFDYGPEFFNEFIKKVGCGCNAEKHAY